jgi:hypothetical protein
MQTFQFGEVVAGEIELRHGSVVLGQGEKAVSQLYYALPGAKMCKM